MKPRTLPSPRRGAGGGGGGGVQTGATRATRARNRMHVMSHKFFAFHFAAMRANPKQIVMRKKFVPTAIATVSCRLLILVDLQLVI